jgi:hypothetical protein
VPKADAGNEAEAPVGDPRTAGIRRIGVAAQDCHAPRPWGHGRFTRIAPDRHRGREERERPARPELGGARAAGVRELLADAVKKERFAARDEALA